MSLKMKIRWRVSITLALTAAIGILAWDTVTPLTIGWEPGERGGQTFWRAPGLIVQQEYGDALWATRGFSVYRSERGQAFEKVHTVYPELGYAWGGFSRTLRAYLRHQELAEVVPLARDEFLVIAGGAIERVDLASGSSESTHDLRYFGLGEGRGVMPHGVAVDDRGWVYYGEYVTRALDAGETIRLYRSRDGGRSWETAYELSSSEVRHIHAVRWDRHAKLLWLTTGDSRHEPMVAYSEDRGDHFTAIGSGRQILRTTSLAFSREAVTWISDSPKDTRIATWRRDDRELIVHDEVLAGTGYYVQDLGGERQLATTGERAIALYVIEPAAAPRKLLEWPVDFDPRRPNPVARLSRIPATGSWVYVSPLRALSEDEGIYRIARP